MSGMSSFFDTSRASLGAREKKTSMMSHLFNNSCASLGAREKNVRVLEFFRHFPGGVASPRESRDAALVQHSWGARGTKCRIRSTPPVRRREPGSHLFNKSRACLGAREKNSMMSLSFDNARASLGAREAKSRMSHLFNSFRASLGARGKSRDVALFQQFLCVPLSPGEKNQKIKDVALVVGRPGEETTNSNSSSALLGAWGHKSSTSHLYNKISQLSIKRRRP